MEVKEVITDYFFIQTVLPCQSVPEVSPSSGDTVNLIFHLNFTLIVINQIKKLVHHIHGKQTRHVYTFIYIIFSFIYQAALKHLVVILHFSLFDIYT